MIPNMLIDTLHGVPLALYGQLKGMAGEKGVAYPSHSTLCKKLDITRNTLKKYVSLLETERLISFTGYQIVKTKGGEQTVKSYRIVDIWKRNTDYFHDKGYQKKTPLSKGVSKIEQRGVKIITKGCQNNAPNKNTINKIEKDSSFQEPPQEWYEAKKRLASRKNLNSL
jgi:DNA-binding transcriptional MocR family regulator